MTHKYALEDPDDIGYRRQWTTDSQNHSHQFVYDNKTYDSKEAGYDELAEGGELKNTATFYNLSDTDFKEGNGQAPSAATSDSSDPVSIHHQPICI